MKHLRETVDGLHSDNKVLHSSFSDFQMAFQFVLKKCKQLQSESRAKDGIKDELRKSKTENELLKFRLAELDEE